ncbi:MAG: TrkH family potassium uptake protein, partial [Lentisphaeria bacterium]|nr:TrkH family potassium uptake protein [Lentisphaeria bacterium]
TKLVLLATGILLVISTFTMHFKGDSSGELLSMVDSWYMSVSGCSAGFNSVDMESISDVALALIMFLMLVGGAPGSTAGGLKISTVAVAAAAIWSTIAGNRKTIVFKRHIPTDNVMRAFAVITLFAILVVIGSVAVKLSAPDENLSLGRLLFEAVSAICTVGLSIGDTSVRMETFGRIISMVLMYIGRIGPLTLLIFLLAREKPGKTGYPEERVIIG